LDYDTEYKWKVVAVQSDGNRATSTEFRFTTEERKYALPTVAILSPEPGSTEEASQVTLTWEATPGEQTNTSAREATIPEYKVHYAPIDEDYPLTPVTTDGKSYTLTNLASRTTYKYKVEAVQSDGQSVETSEATFSTRNGAVLRYNESGILQKSYQKISEAVAESHHRDRIEVDGGTILTNEEHQITISGTEVTISSNNETPFTINMEGRDRVFELTGNASVTMSRIIVTGGATETWGGGLFVTEGSTLTTRNATITGNVTANIGGGVFVYTPDMERSGFFAYETVINDNSANSGGGFCSWLADVLLEACMIAGNTSSVGSGGAVMIGNGTATMACTTVRGNTANTYGGGILLYSGAVLTVVDSEISENTAAAGAGGGIYMNTATLTAYQARIDHNIAATEGGGIYCMANGLVFEDVSISNNEAQNGNGGGISLMGFMDATNTTLSGNSATTTIRGGGGLYFDNGGVAYWGVRANALTISGNTVSGTAGNGGGAYICRGAFTTANTSLIATNTAANDGGGIFVDGQGVFEANGVTIAGNSAGNVGGGIVRSDFSVFRTSGNGWTNTGDKGNAFSVALDGAVNDTPDALDPVQVYGNIAGTVTTNQMKWE
jgi:hypothetical protein